MRTNDRAFGGSMTTIELRTDTRSQAAAPGGARIDVREVSQHAGATELLHHVSLSIAPGELVAVVGGRGAGKTTPPETRGGGRGPSAGTVSHDGSAATLTPGAVGFVPQDDIIHRALPL